MLKSLQSVQSDEGTHRPNGRVTRDFSILTRIMKNLTKQLGHQKKRVIFNTYFWSENNFKFLV